MTACMLLSSAWRRWLCQCVDTHSQGSPARTSAADDSRPCLQGAQQVGSAIACTEAQRWQRG